MINQPLSISKFIAGWTPAFVVTAAVDPIPRVGDMFLISFQGLPIPVVTCAFGLLGIALSRPFARRSEADLSLLLKLLVSAIMLVTVELWIVQSRPDWLYAFVVSVGFGFAGFSLLELFGDQITQLVRDAFGKVRGSIGIFFRRKRMNGAWVQVAIIIIILAGFGAVLWKGGAANPVGTGALQSRVTAIDASVKAIKDDLGRTADEMKALKEGSPSGAEIVALRETMQGDRRRTEQVFLKIENVESELAEMRLHQGTRDVVIEALSASVRKLSSDLHEHQVDIARKLDQLNTLSGRIDANAKAIDALVSQLPALREKQAEIAARQAETASDVKHVKGQVDRLYDFLTEKALK